MRQNKQDAKQIFWKPRELEGGLIEVIVPYGTVIEPDARKRYAHRWGSYHTKDPRFGGDAYVYEDTDYDLGMRVKRVYMNVPLETMAVCCGNDGIEFKGQRDQDDHRDKRPLEGWEDENGNWHYGAESEAATLDEYFAGQEDAHISQNDAEKPEYPTEVLHGPLSDDYRIRSAQVKYMCGIVERAMEARSETLQRTFLALFHQRMQGVDYAEEEGVGESAITNRKNRLIAEVGKVFKALGFLVPSKAEVKAEEKAYQERMVGWQTHLAEIDGEKRKEERETDLIRQLAKVFYENGCLDDVEMDEINEELDSAA